MIRRPIYAALSLSIMLLGMQSAKAQITTVQETITSPQTITTMPIVEKTVTTTTTNTTPLTPVFQSADISRKTIYMEGPVGSTSSSSTLLINDKELGRENYAQRLAKMQEQINLGVNRGYISSGEGSILSAQQADLSDLEARVCASGFNKADSDDLEKRMNALNIRISNALTNGMQSAGAGNLQ